MIAERVSNSGEKGVPVVSDDSAGGLRQIADIVTLIQELTSKTIACESTSNLFPTAFPILFRYVPFDIAVAVMLEQNLDLYICTRQNAEALVNDQLIARVRRSLQNLIPVSFEHTDIVVKAERHVLPNDEETAPGLTSEISMIMNVQNRPAGVLVLFRSNPAFAAEHMQLLEIFASQVSLLAGNLRAREQILSLADTDDLTGIRNKRYFRRHLPLEVERSRIYGFPLSMLLVDVDDFKHVNDTFGHAVGDVVLSEMCGAVREMLRPPDLFARIGGDEFAVVLPHTDVSGACSVALRILHRVNEVVIPADEQGEVRCSVSIGLALLEPDDATADDLVRRADERLYAAKRGGKNRFVAV